MVDWTGVCVVVIGAARQGVALTRYLVEHGACVVLNDQRPLEELEFARKNLADVETEFLRCIWGGHPLEVLEGADLVCLSGGVPLSIPLIQEAQRRGIPLSNDSQIFLEAATCPVIGITGSAGKTTTTTLVGRMAEVVVKKVWVGGNIGSPLISILDEMSPDDLAVMELSSFQLEIMTRAPHVAAILNITPNHLDRHPGMDAYIAAKRRILDYQNVQSVAVLGRDDPGAWNLNHRVHGRLFSFGIAPLPLEQDGTSYLDGELYLHRGGERAWIMSRAHILLRGEHNLLNVLAACAIGAAVNLPSHAMRRGVEGFQGVPHRLELVRVVNGVSWYNDSIATAPERAMAAINSFDESLVLLAGGRDKNLPWEDFVRLARRRVDHLILFGEAAEKIEKAFGADSNAGEGRSLTLARCKSLVQALEEASRITESGDVVLLSPGCTSFDEFRDFEDRGEAFRQWVMKIH